MENLNPKVHAKVETRKVTIGEADENHVDEIDSREVFGKFVRYLYDNYNTNIGQG